MLLGSSLKELTIRYPYLGQFLEAYPFVLKQSGDIPLGAVLRELESRDEDLAFDAGSFIAQLQEFIQQMQEFLGQEHAAVEVLTILPGFDKQGNPEGFEKLELAKGSVTSIVGPTGSGKSRLLADIEWVAQGDTPTGRRVLVNNRPPLTDWRYASGKKLVAQLSQNMNFVMDLEVEEFLMLHARSRMIANADGLVRQIIAQANELAGEKFGPHTPITALSGGQSRALMIADTAILSASPVVLIDEIENAGIDRRRALDLLIREEKIVLMATHDPILALMADQRIVISNGGISRLIKTSDVEKAMLAELEHYDKKMMQFRNQLRHGGLLHEITDL
ncbi:MAG: ATP-binding cassette domain-containing protein [Bacteroidetes bacterium]|nr:ATP-binding cassette domain-containing protein [Bacteroidota bacterium]